MQSSGEAPKLLRDVAYERLRDAITRGELLPATPLSEVQLAREMEISRTPIRQALQQLALEGLVRAIPGCAIRVAAPSINEVMNVVHMRRVLEPELARLAAKYVTTEMKSFCYDKRRKTLAGRERRNYSLWRKWAKIAEEKRWSHTLTYKRPFFWPLLFVFLL